MLASFAHRACLVALIVIAIPLLPRAGQCKPVEIHDIPIPARSRSQGENQFASSRGFRRTVQFYQRFFKRTGLPHHAIPIYAYRGTSIARFVSKNPRSRWLAVHVYRQTGRTAIYIVPRPLDHEPNSR